MSATVEEKTHWLDRPVVPILKLNLEQTLYIVIILLAIFTRFWMLGDRAMSHDESLHTYYSWNLYKGGGFSHTPLMHGPFRFHLNALVYSILGADDFTARIPTAIFGIVLVALPYVLRRWLTRTGAVVTSFMLLISPSIMYHARYIRDEGFMLVWGTLLAWAIFSYLRSRNVKWLFMLAVVMGFMFTTMESAFIFTAIYGFFLIIALLIEMSHHEDFWHGIVGRLALGVGGVAVILFVAMLLHAFLLNVIGLGPELPSPFPAPVQPLQPGLPIEFSVQLQYILQLALAVLKVGLSMLIPAVLIGMGVYYWIRWSWPRVVKEAASFDLVIVLGTLSLFMLSAGVLPTLNTIWQAVYQKPFVNVNFFEGGNFPTTDVGLVLRIAVVAFAFIAAAIAIGWWWNGRRWVPMAASFVGIGITFFTTVFTNGVGLGTGFVGSLGYWLVQQGVQRGTQPPYYYLFVTSVYEYFPMLIAAIAIITYAVRAARDRRFHLPDVRSWDERLFIPFVIVWTVASWIAYSWAGEKMPWLMVYLALPMIVLSGRFIGEWLDTIDWRAVIAERQWLIGLLWAAAIVSGAWTIGNLQKAFGGLQLDSLMAFSSWVAALIVFVLCVGGLVWLKPRPSWRVIRRMSALIGVLVLVGLTIRTGWIWNFINYDSALEFGVYAHGGPGVKEVMRQIDEYAARSKDGKNIRIVFDADASWPFFWYLRDYPNKGQISNTPSRTDLEAPIIISSAATWNSVDAAVRKTHTYWQGHRIWWPMEDYKVFADCPGSELDAATGQSVNVAAFDENNDGTIDAAEKARGQARCNAYFIRHIPDSIATVARWLIDVDRRSALVDIFLNRDYTAYDKIRNGVHQPDNWPLVDDFRLYVRKDLASSVWTEAVGGVSPVTQTEQVDPYAKGWKDIAAVTVWGATGTEPGQFQSPHAIAVGPDGAVYVADGFNHRIQKFDQDGNYVASIGSSSNQAPNPPNGQFNEPWGVAVAPDGSIVAADTWNHRIQIFNSDGSFQRAWGTLGDTGGQAIGSEGSFYGPRGVAVDKDGRIYVADTGNKRIQVFDKDGKFINQFGGGGLDQGRLDEPVGVAVDAQGNIVVADTWNGRVQIFDQTGAPIAAWDIDGWLDKEAVGKPYLAVDAQSRVYVADEVGRRVLIFDETGKYLGGFGQYGTDDRGFTLPGGIAVDKGGYIYVVDTGSGRVLKFPPFEAAGGN